uniref:Reverse transcriptase n=1 Tax=Cannabis sativa TaxID=3483 RepID=A0A803NMF8_CANSA
MYGGPLAMGSGLLPTDTVRCVVGYCIPFFHVRKNNPSILDPVDHSPSISLSFPLKPKSTPSVLEPQLLYSSFSISTSLGLVIMASSNDSLVNEMIAETENCCLEDFSIQVAPDLESAQETIAKTVVGRLYSKKMISHGTLRKTLSGIPQEVKFVLENGPWNPCGGFLLVTSLPEDGRWESADLLKLDIWVKAKGVPLPYLTEDCLAQMAKRMGLLLSANKVRRNGIVVNDFLRFQVRLDLSRPLLAGVSLPEINQKKIWSYFKYERLPIFCYKCGVIGHLEDDCSGLKRMVTAHNGRSLPLYGSWLKDGSRLENGFALLEVEEIQDIQRLEKEDISTGGNGPSAAPPAAQLGGVAIQFPEKSTGDRGNPGCAEVADVPAGRTRVEQVGMEGVVSQKGDNEFNVAYNDYVDMTHFPSKHVIHVANLFKDKLGPIKFGAAREEVDQTGPKSGLVQKLKKPKLIGPRGIPKPSIFGRRPNNMGHSSGAKRKKLLNDVVNVDPFVAESDGLSCLVGVDKTGIKDAFAEESGVNHLANSNSSDVSVDPNKKSRLLINSLRSNEGSFGFIQEQKDGINGSAPTDETKMANLPPGHKSGTIQVSEQSMSIASDARIGGSPAAKKALRALVLREDPDVLFLMETKLNRRRMNSIWRSLGFGGASCVDAIGSAGGLCLCWKAGVEVLISSAEAGVITGVFSNVLNGPDWTGLFIYGPPVRADKKVFWEARMMEIMSLNHPWVLVGDLNTISGQCDKFGGRLVEEGEGHFLLDLMTVTGVWILVARAGVKSLAIKDSDHAAVLLDLLFDRERFKTPFRYLDAWSRDESCKDVIREAWAISVHGIRSFQLVSKLDNTRRRLSIWNRTHFGLCKEKLKTLNRLLLEVQQRIPSEDNLKLEADILLEIEEVEIRQAEIWKQKSRELWYKDGDRNSRFFHAATVIKRKRNFIDSVTPDGLGWISGRNAVGDYFRANFISLLSSSSPPPPQLQHLIQTIISDGTNSNLIRPPSASEIKEVVWSMPPLKAPGPDGMPGKFFKDHWEIVGQDVIDAVKKFFENGELDRRINQTFMVLIPKKIGANCFDDYRPISLCNFTYKIIAKLLANRIKPLLSDIISPTQSAFAPGRWIAENSILAHEIMDSFKKCKGRSGFVGLKLDMSKAYDRIELGFLEHVLGAFGFGGHFIRLLMKCVRSVSFSILLNGGPLKQFYPKRGLCQGDPLSPYLFILCSEVLSRLLLREEDHGRITGFKVSRSSPPISHLMYADDTLIFCKADMEEIETVQECIRTYCEWSGQCINVRKSAYVFSKNMDDSRKAEIVSLLGFRGMNRDDKFLGNPILWSNSKVKDFKFIKDRLCARIEGWRCKLLSQAGRTTLIRSVAASTPVYSMSTFLLPKVLCHEMDQAIRKFWWIGNAEKDRYLALTNWNTMCSPLEDGGLNFKKFEDMNLALVAKLGWKLAKGENSLWTRVFCAKYWEGGIKSFWNHDSPKSLSFGARSILASRDLIRKESCFLIANGRATNLRHAPWIPWLDWDQFRAAFNPMITPISTHVSSLLNEEREWDYLQAATWMVPSVASSLHLISLLPIHHEDRLIWKDATNGEFSPLYTNHLDANSGHPSLSDLQEPLLGDFVVYVDAACKDLRSAAGIITTNSNSALVEAFSVALQAKSPLEAEAWALLHAVHRCVRLGRHNVNFVLDCQSLVYGIKQRKTPDWKMAAVFELLLDGLDRIPLASVSWIPRSRNEIAHRLAKWSFNSSLFGFFTAEELAPLVAF